MEDEKKIVMQALGKRLKDLRLQRGLTQSELAKLAGVSRVRIYQAERGEANPQFLTLYAIAKALHCDVSTLVCIMHSLPLPPPPSFEQEQPKIVVYTTPLRSLQES